MSNRLVRISKIIILLLFGASTIGCNRADPHPELKDPIYLDLVNEHGKHAKFLEEAEKTLVTVESELEKVEPRSLDRKIKNREYQKALKEIVKLRQKTEYYRIKSELRKVYGRKAYKIAFKNGETWPNPKEHEDYEINKRLRAASRNWSERIPKLKHQEVTEEKMKGE